jgi:hypothetical protein
MTDPTPSASKPRFSSDSLPLDSIKVKPGDEKLLNTGFGKMFASMSGAGDQDQDTLIKEIKVFMNQYCQSILRDMKHQDERMKAALQKLKNVAEGRDPDE